MKASEMLDRVDTFKPNQYTEPQKLGWLLQLDGQIWREIIRTHEGGEDIAQPDGSAGVERELLVPEPWAGDLYNYWLQAMIDRENGEIGKYNQTSQLYNRAYLTYAGVLQPDAHADRLRADEDLRGNEKCICRR